LTLAAKSRNMEITKTFPRNSVMRMERRALGKMRYVLSMMALSTKEKPEIVENLRGGCAQRGA
jgi:hypothetical protein